jgi:hypothetical protein
MAVRDFPVAARLIRLILAVAVAAILVVAEQVQSAVPVAVARFITRQRLAGFPVVLPVALLAQARTLTARCHWTLSVPPTIS